MQGRELVPGACAFFFFSQAATSLSSTPDPHSLTRSLSCLLSCQVIMPAVHCDRSNDIYVSSYSTLHGVAPKGKWVVVASTRVEGATDGLEALAIAKRELASVLPLLKPTRKLLAEVVPYHEPRDDVPERLLVLSSSDETTDFDSVEEEVAELFERITGEPPVNIRPRPRG